MADIELKKPPVCNVIIAGSAIIAVFFGVFGVWAGIAPISTAAIAPGEVTVESRRKTVQHLEGGIVKRIAVRDGDVVKKGQVLIHLDPTQPGAVRSLMEGRLLAARTLAARLRAERENLSGIKFPPDLLARSSDAEVREAIEGQRRIFTARRKAIANKINLLKKRDGQVRSEIRGLRAQVRADDKQLKLIEQELTGVRTLVKKGLVAKPRLLALERRAAEIGGNRGRNTAAIARAEQSIGETRLKIEELKTARANEIARELRAVEEQLLDLRERNMAAADVFSRTEIRAPIAGTVVGLKISTPGGVVAPGEALMDIVPADDALIVEAKVMPQDIDIVRPGLSAQVRFTALSQRNSVPVEGDVVSVSADRLADQFMPEGYYLARVILSPEAMDALGGVDLHPGMRAEVMIVTGARTALSYFLKPITDSFNRSFREE